MNNNHDEVLHSVQKIRQMFKLIPIQCSNSATNNLNRTLFTDYNSDLF